MSSAQTSQAPAFNSAPITGTIDASTFRNIAQAQTAMVVNIRTESQQSNELNEFFGGDDFFRRFFGQPSPEQQQPRESARSTPA